MKAKKMVEVVLTFFDCKDDLITNKKLQKILYYIEAWSLVYHSSVIDEDFEAWVHGPVVPSIYHHFKKFGYSPIQNKYKKGETPSSRWNELNGSLKLKKDEMDLIVEVLNKYGSLSSFELEKLSHSELPWLQARGEAGPFDACFNTIDKKIMKQYYSSLVDVKE
jgi:uncharacterized phage-associated protein